MNAPRRPMLVGPDPWSERDEASALASVAAEGLVPMLPERARDPVEAGVLLAMAGAAIVTWAGRAEMGGD